MYFEWRWQSDFVFILVNTLRVPPRVKWPVLTWLLEKMLVLPLMLPDISITNAMEFSAFRFRNLAKMSSPTVERMSLRNMLVASAARSAAILWRLQDDDFSIGHLHDGVILLLRPQRFSFFLSYLNLEIPGRFRWQNFSFAQESKTLEDSGRSSKMRSSCIE